MIKNGFISILFLFCNYAYAQKAKATLQPNVIFILVDDMGWNDLSCYGNKFIETPNIDRLAAKGVKFENAYSSSPVCSPSRAAFLTGKNPAILNITDWLPGRAFYVPKENIGKVTPPVLEDGITANHKTIGYLFKESGYKTASVGKWHLGDGKYAPKNYGFDFVIGGYHHGSPASYFYPYNGNYAGKPYSMSDLQIGGKNGEYLTDRLTDETINFIIQNKEDPFFVYLSHYAPHIPIDPKPSLLEKYRNKQKQQQDSSFKNAEYAALIASIDESVGKIEKALDSLKLLDKTIIVFTSDNGGVTTNDGPFTPACNLNPLKGGKGILYEGGIRVPAIMYSPFSNKLNISCNNLITTTDWFPTLLSLAGIKFSTKDLDGINLTSYLNNNNKALNRSIFWHYPHYSNQGGKPSSAIRNGDWKLIKNYEDGSLELYNINNDISESKNLIYSNPKVTNELCIKLEVWLKKTKAKIPLPNIYFKKIAN